MIYFSKAFVWTHRAHLGFKDKVLHQNVLLFSWFTLAEVFGRDKIWKFDIKPIDDGATIFTYFGNGGKISNSTMESISTSQ